MQKQTVLTIGAHILPSTTCQIYDIKIEFNSNSTSASSDKQLKQVVEEKIKNKKFFYGIEISARNYYPNAILDYRSFGSLLPLFTSIVWLSSEYWSIENIEEVESIKLARKLQPHGMVLPHFSCYRLNQSRLEEFLNLNYSNIFAIRGDSYDEIQEFKYTMDMVEKIRKLKGDSVTIGVAGYPEGHPECLSMDQDLNNLVKKVKAGSDFIITQICFSAQIIIDFIKNCRAKEIKIPILVGVFVPENLRILETILRITKIKMPIEELEEYRSQHLLGHEYFRDYSIHKAVDMIKTIFASDVEVYGLQFFTMNKFENIPKVLDEIHKNLNLRK